MKMMIIPAAVLVLSSAPAAAQSLSVVSRDGAGNGALVSQGSANDSLSIIVQNATGTPAGGDNLAVVVQSDDPALGPLLANVSIIDQGGHRNAATILQVHRGGYGRNLSAVRQTGVDGDGSRITLRQFGRNVSNIDQAGNGSTAAVLQGHALRSASGNLSQLAQDSDDTAAILQNAVGAPTSVDGHGANVATVNQGTGANQALVRQTGLTSHSRIDQSTGAWADVAQHGEDGRSVLVQTEAASASITQDSDGTANAFPANRSAVAQAGLLGVVNSNQIGTDNDSAIDQAAAFGAADVLQAGLHLESDVSQQGHHQLAEIVQTGRDNRSLVAQSGAGQRAFVIQTSDGNVSEVTQAGWHNLVSVTQGP